jgi:hypothetical protein
MVKVLELPALSAEADEERAFQILIEGRITTNGLVALRGCSTAKARKILQGLIVKGLTEISRHGRRVPY